MLHTNGDLSIGNPTSFIISSEEDVVDPTISEAIPLGSKVKRLTVKGGIRTFVANQLILYIRVDGGIDCPFIYFLLTW